MAKPKQLTLYERLIVQIFLERHTADAQTVEFTREDIISHAQQLGIRLPKNLGDVVYTFRYRSDFPEQIALTARRGRTWIIRSNGKARYKFVQVTNAIFAPNQQLASTRIPDATPGIIVRYAMNDEQALLARVRYNRLIDIFTGVTCYSLQNHLRTTVRGLGQVETDEVYVGIDTHGAHYVFPVQAKAGRDRLGVVQIEQDLGICSEKFPKAIGRPIAAQFLSDGTIALMEFIDTKDGPRVHNERHYALVSPDRLTEQELASYTELASRRR